MILAQNLLRQLSGNKSLLLFLTGLIFFPHVKFSNR